MYSKYLIIISLLIGTIFPAYGMEQPEENSLQQIELNNTIATYNATLRVRTVAGILSIVGLVAGPVMHADGAHITAASVEAAGIFTLIMAIIAHVNRKKLRTRITQLHRQLGANPAEIQEIPVPLLVVTPDDQPTPTEQQVRRPIPVVFAPGEEPFLATAVFAPNGQRFLATPVTTPAQPLASLRVALAPLPALPAINRYGTDHNV